MSERDAKFWDKAAFKYSKSKISDEVGYLKTIERTREIFRSFYPERTGKVLELGCGTGTSALKLASDAGHYLATDISSGMIAIAKEKQSSSGLENLSFLVATAETVVPPKGGFDVILGFNYLHLVADPTATLVTIRKLLNPSGLLITKTVCLNEMNAALPALITVMRWIGKAPSNISRFSGSDLAAAHRAAGFEILHNERHGTKGKDVRPFIVARPR